MKRARKESKADLQARKLREHEEYFLPKLIGRKRVGYAYPTSPLAEDFDLADVGMYYVIADGHGIRVFRGDQRQDAFEYADSLPLPYDLYSHRPER